MKETCDICRASDAMRPILDVSLSGVMDASVCECGQCGFRQVRPRLQRHELSILYPADYFDSASHVGFRDYHRQQQRAEREAFFLAKRLKRIAPTGRLLEVGCALGFLLDGVRRFSNWTVMGVDVSEFGIYFARKRFGLDAICGTLEEVGFEDESFDFIVQKDLLEHVPDPRALLAETRRILKPGGRLWLITPNGEANIRPLQKIARRIQQNGQDLLPRLDQGHISFFQFRHLESLFAEFGFKRVRAASVGVRRGLRAMGIVPMKEKHFITGPRGNARHMDSPEKETLVDYTGDVGGPAMQRLYDRICAEIEASNKPLRSKPAYFRFRQMSMKLDELPRFLSWANDFEFLLVKK